MSLHKLVFMIGLLITLLAVGLDSATAPAAPAGAQNPIAPAAENPPVVIKAESNLVLVDVIATDKKGNYITDLEKNDFHVFEDDAEQSITSFSHEADITPNAPAHQRYMVLFFDDSTMDPALQLQARKAAGKFVESTASPNRLMAVVDFGGTLQIAQNFTANGDLLKAAVSTVKMSSINPNAGAANVQLASMGAPSLAGTQSDFAARSVLLSIREVAKILRTVPGRKTLILFSAGFALTPERQSELTATIDALNKANIAVYPVDVRGLAVTASPGMDISNPSVPGTRPGLPPGSELLSPDSPFAHLPGLWAALAAPFAAEPQRGGGAGGGGGTGGSGGVGGGTSSSGSSGSKGGSSTTGSTGSTGTSSSSGTKGGGSPSGRAPSTGSGGTQTNPRNNSYTNVNCTNPNMTGGLANSNCINRQIVPTIPDSVATNQQVLYALAKGTGGFEIFNTNDFLSGLQKIAKEMNEYYNLGYIPPHQAHDGSYHKISVKVTRDGVVLRYRTGYFDIRNADLLQGKPEGKALEDRAASQQPGEIPVSVSVPYFYTEPDVARVNLALAIPGSAIDFEKQKNVFHSDVNVLGIAYRANGSVAARFSDTVKLDYQKKDLKDFAKGSFDYQNTFDIAPGSYTLKLVLSAGGEKFGKYQVPLVVEPFSGETLSLAGPALGDKYVPVSQPVVNMDAALLEDRTPLVFHGMEFVQSASYRFSRGSEPVVYLEVYDPVLKMENTPRVGLLFNIIDRKSNQQVFSSNTVLINQFLQPGNPLVPVGFKLPVAQMQAGDYRVEIKGRDEMGNVSTVRAADFSIE
jgi:VWFA-related protein